MTWAAPLDEPLRASALHSACFQGGQGGTRPIARSSRRPTVPTRVSRVLTCLTEFAALFLQATWAWEIEQRSSRIGSILTTYVPVTS